jgi:hypothetical protein
MAYRKSFRAIWLNCAVVAGIIIGFSTSGYSLSAQVAGIVAVFFFAFFNLLFLEAHPRLAQSAPGNRSNVYKEALAAVTERPIITMLVVLQLWAVARCLGTVITLARVYSTPQIASQNLQARTAAVCTAMAFVGLLWLTSAAGIWHKKVWAWWLALILNAVDAGTTILIQLFAPHQFLVDVVALLAIALLLLPKTRSIFRTHAPVPVLPTS